MQITSSAFTENEAIPKDFTCDGANKSPELSISDLPSDAESLVLIVDDPDAPGKTFLHWLAYNIDPSDRIPENATPGTQGSNDFGKSGYGGPCPPSGTHRYFFRVYALDTSLGLPQGAGRGEVEQAMKGHVLDQAQLMGTYGR
jgi:hypothetical protein